MFEPKMMDAFDTFWLVGGGQLLLAVKEVFLVQKGYYAK